MPSSTLHVHFQRNDDGTGMAYVPSENGGNAQPFARMTYHHLDAKRINVDHTEVKPDMQGEGVGMLLLQNLVQWAREHDVVVEATCPYAVAQFAKHPELQDVYERSANA